MKEILRKYVKKYRPDSEIVDFSDVSGHENDTFVVELEGGEELVCTLCTGDEVSNACRKEVIVGERVREKTGIKTPEIVFSDCSGSPPFYISRRIEGVNGQDFFEVDPRPSARERKEFTGNVGRLMGRLHSGFSLEAAGEIDLKNNEVGVKGSHSFLEYFSDLLESEVEKLDETKFSDIKDEVSDAVRQSLDIIGDPEVNSLIHHDIRPDNMILDGTEVKALLDWEHVTSGHPLIDYAHTEIHLAEPHLYYDVDLQNSLPVNRLRNELRRGYEQEKELPESFRQQVEAFKMLEHIRNMNTFDSYADSVGMSDKERRKNRREHKQRFRKMKSRFEGDEEAEFVLK